MKPNVDNQSSGTTNESVQNAAQVGQFFLFKIINILQFTRVAPLGSGRREAFASRG